MEDGVSAPRKPGSRRWRTGNGREIYVGTRGGVVCFSTYGAVETYDRHTMRSFAEHLLRSLDATEPKR